MKVKDRLTKIPDIYKLDFTLKPRRFPNMKEIGHLMGYGVADLCIDKADRINTLTGMHAYIIETLVRSYFKSLDLLDIAAKKIEEDTLIQLPRFVLGLPKNKPMVILYEKDSKDVYTVAGQMLDGHGLDTVLIMIHDISLGDRVSVDYELHRYDEFVNMMLGIEGPHGFEVFLPETDDNDSVDKSMYVSTKGDGQVWN